MKHHKMSSQTSVFQNEDNKEEELIYFLSNLFSALKKNRANIFTFKY